MSGDWRDLVLCWGTRWLTNHTVVGNLVYTGKIGIVMYHVGFSGVMRKDEETWYELFPARSYLWMKMLTWQKLRHSTWSMGEGRLGKVGSWIHQWWSWKDCIPSQEPAYPIQGTFEDNLPRRAYCIPSFLFWVPCLPYWVDSSRWLTYLESFWVSEAAKHLVLQDLLLVRLSNRCLALVIL